MPRAHPQKSEFFDFLNRACRTPDKASPEKRAPSFFIHNLTSKMFLVRPTFLTLRHQFILRNHEFILS